VSPRLRVHLVTAVLFAAVVLVLAVLWWARALLVYLLALAVGGVVYYALFRFVKRRLATRGGEPPAAGPDDEVE
jgi:uncharacterized membrane-anchored protein